jgi:hypothetical protein
MVGPTTFEPGRPVEPSALYVGAPASGAGLPPAVAERFFAILDRTEMLHAAMPASEQRLELANEKVKAEKRLQQLEAHSSESSGLGPGFGLGPTDSRVVQQRALLSELGAAKDRMEARYQRTSEAWQKAAQVRTAVEQWLRDRPPTAVEDWPTELPNLTKGQDLLSAIETHRRRARELVADLKRIEAAPYPRDYCRQKATAEVLALAERGRIIASGLVEHDSSLTFPVMHRKFTTSMRAAPLPLPTTCPTCWQSSQRFTPTA